MIRAPTGPRALLASHGLRPKRRFGQSFLGDPHLAARIAELATTPPGGTVVEIGAGTGALTRPLLARAARVVAIERDRDLLPVLRSELAAEIEAERLELQEVDAKQAPLRAWLESGPPPRVLAGNLPYQITGPLLERTVGLAPAVDRVVLLVQLEVAARLTARAGDASYGALSVFVQARFEPKRELVVRRGAFYPQPRVDSAVVVLRPREAPLAVETDAFRALVRAAFGKRRKKLRNAWSGVLGTSAEQLAGAAARAGVDLELRGEVLHVSEFARLAEEIGR